MVARALGRFGLFAVLLPGLAALPAASGCNTGTTPGFPQPDLQAPPGEPFILRAGVLALVAAPQSFLYLSVQETGADTRCPEGASCPEAGFLILRLELETADLQNALTLRVSDEGQATATFQGFEIRILGTEPGGREERILPTEYAFLIVVTQR